ncbi:CBS domain-containing protein [Asticcacaulis sp.]|uniref:CBS domain-containing protein n=1 Tax=Asticcacaulis sp. TaxID=1872648 RepID=UPI002CED8B81|nr:CBS domain-containing protein [Asticcacaulis sp.]HTM81230.1 CBS domain-containing protein [Asticcacaulis sp.]
MHVKDIMSTDFHIASPQTTLRQAAEIMRDGDFGYLPVGDTFKLKGAVTDRDIVIRAVAAGMGPDTHLSDVMSETIVYCFEDDDLREAADVMKREQIRRLAVLNDSKRLVGVITLGDIARADEQRLAGEIELEVAQI